MDRLTWAEKKEYMDFYRLTLTEVQELFEEWKDEFQEEYEEFIDYLDAKCRFSK